MSIDKLGAGTLNRLFGPAPAADGVQAGGGTEPSTTVPLGDVSTVSPQARTEARTAPYDYIATLPPGYQPTPRSSRDIEVFQAQGIEEVRGDQAAGVQPVAVPPAEPVIVQAPVPPPVVIPPPVQPPVVSQPIPAPPPVTPSPVGPLTPPVPEPEPTPVPATPSPLGTLQPPTPEPAADPEPERKPLGRRLRFTSVADPHVTTADGRKFDNSKIGDFVLARTKSGDLSVQVHQDKIPNDSGVWQTKAAIKTHGDVIRFDAATRRLELNGAVIPFEAGQKIPLPSGGYLEMSKDVLENGTPFHRLRVHTKEGDDLYMLQFERKGGGRYLDLSGSLAPTRESGEVMGSAGSFDGDGNASNDLRSRTGRILQDLAAFLEDWRVRSEESLF